MRALAGHLMVVKISLSGDPELIKRLKEEFLDSEYSNIIGDSNRNKDFKPTIKVERNLIQLELDHQQECNSDVAIFVIAEKDLKVASIPLRFGQACVIVCMSPTQHPSGMFAISQKAVFLFVDCEPNKKYEARSVFETATRVVLNYTGLYPGVNTTSRRVLPNAILEDLPHLNDLDMSYNLLETIPSDLATIPELNAVGNPLSTIHPAYRTSNEKIKEYISLSGSIMQPWQQMKLMLVGQEGVGKTTFLRSLQNNKYKCDTNISTNGVDIESFELPLSPSTSILSALTGKKENGIKFKVWDFGGQSVFHSTHRFFLTSNAIYLILYNMHKPETIDRIQYWIEQIGLTEDFEGTKPILIVGTHADKFTKQQQQQQMKELQQMYPISSPQNIQSQICGHFMLGLTPGEKAGLSDLHAKLVKIALNHPKIGIKQVQVPISLICMEEKFNSINPYIKWSEYYDLAKQWCFENEITLITELLHNTGTIVWHNVPKLRDFVFTNPQWLANAMAGVVSFISQKSASISRGMVHWSTIQEWLKLKFPNQEIHETIISLLESFEIVYRMKMSGISATITSVLNEQLFFVPSLLLARENTVEHPAIQHWGQFSSSKTFDRKFSWAFYPSGFFPRLIWRLAHLRVRIIMCWLDSAVILGPECSECALLQLNSENGQHCLEIRVKTDKSHNKQEPLITTISYIVSQLHRDMYTKPMVPIVHDVLVTVQNSVGNTTQQVVKFETFIQAQTEGNTFLPVGESMVKINKVVPDLSGCSLIPVETLTIINELGQGSFGVVYKATLKQPNSLVEVAVKELQMKEQDAIYEFQHEVAIMSKLQHKNLVKLYGITKSPLQMILEYVPFSDLHHVLKDYATKSQLQLLTLKWKLKVAIDVACGLKYLHSQCPPICHSDLRTPNIFIASLEENANAIGKIADFGLSQQVFSYANKELHNITETAPETWYNGFYDEKSDIFSFAVILWHLFGSLIHYKQYDESKQEDDEYAFLKRGPPPQQREVIRNGGRLPIHSDCPTSIALLIKDCWKTLPDDRPPFTSILNQLTEIYASECSQDEYLLQKKTESSMPIYTPHKNVTFLPEFHESSFADSMWKPVKLQEKMKVISLTVFSSYVWAGTTNNCLLILDSKSRQLLQKSALLPTIPISPSQSRGTKVLSVENHAIWVAVNNEIHIFSTENRQAMTSPLINDHPITSMVFLPNSVVVWIADLNGFVSIWDAQALRNFYKFQVHKSNCANSMTVLNDYVWMIFGRDIVAVHTTTLEQIGLVDAHNDRIQEIISVPQTDQVWTCARDGVISVWKLVNNKDTNIISKVFEINIGTPVKSACLMMDGLHVATGAFDGSIFMWDIKTFQRVAIPTPDKFKNKSVQCLLDTKDALWCGVEWAEEPLHSHVHLLDSNLKEIDNGYK